LVRADRCYQVTRRVQRLAESIDVGCNHPYLPE
jgi:tRNA A22 N-methylase